MADSVPAFINKLLEATRLSQKAFAGKVGVSQGTVSKWLNERHEPNKRQWDKVLAFAAQNKSTRGLLATAPSISIDAMIEPYDLDIKNGAVTIVEAYLKTVPRPPRL